jgi:hypothetical protein
MTQQTPLPPNFQARTQPRTYRWLGWLLILIVPFLALPPLVWSMNQYRHLKEAPTGAHAYFEIIGEHLIALGKAEQLRNLEDIENLPEEPEDIVAQTSPAADLWVAYYPTTPENPSPSQEEFSHTFPQWCYVSVSSNMPLPTNTRRGFLIEVEHGWFVDPDWGLQNYSRKEFSTKLDETECKLSDVHSTYNNIRYLGGGVMALGLGLLAGFAAYAFDQQDRNPLIEYGIVVGLGTLGVVFVSPLAYGISVLIGGIIGGYLFLRRDVL